MPRGRQFVEPFDLLFESNGILEPRLFKNPYDLARVICERNISDRKRQPRSYGNYLSQVAHGDRTCPDNLGREITDAITFRMKGRPKEILQEQIRSFEHGLKQRREGILGTDKSLSELTAFELVELLTGLEKLGLHTAHLVFLARDRRAAPVRDLILELYKARDPAP